MKKTLTIVLLVALVFSAFSNGQKEPGEIVLRWPNIWVGEDSKAPVIAEMVADFNAAHEGKIRVEVEPQPDYDGYESTLRTRVAANQVPDIFTFKLGPTTRAYYDANLLMDLTSELQGAWANDFTGGALNSVTVDGRMKSIPYEVAVTPVWYNKALFDEAGAEIPNTWDEFLVAAEKLKAAGIVPTSQMTGGANAWTSMLWYCHFLATVGGPDILSPEKQFSDPAYVKAAEMLLAMYSDGNTTRDAVGGDAGVSGGHFLAERTAMFINGPWYIGRVRADAPSVYENLVIGSAPSVNHNDTQVAFLQTVIGAAHTDDPARKEAVVKFLKWLTKPEYIARLTETAGSMFAIRSNASFDSHVQRQFVDVGNNANFSVPHLEETMPVAVVTEFGQALGAMALGQITPQQFVQRLAAAAE